MGPRFGELDSLEKIEALRQVLKLSLDQVGDQEYAANVLFEAVSQHGYEVAEQVFFDIGAEEGIYESDEGKAIVTDSIQKAAASVAGWLNQNW